MSFQSSSCESAMNVHAGTVQPQEIPTPSNLGVAPRGLDPARHAMEVGAWRFLLPLAAT